MSTLGIIAGGGRLPGQLVEACRTSNRPFFILAFEGTPDLMPLEGLPHAVLRLGALGTALDTLRGAGVSEIVLAGRIKRPSINTLKPDAAAMRLLARLGTMFFAGDDALLKAVIAFLEGEGFKVVGSESILGSILATEGPLGKLRPDARAESDIAQGIREAKSLGKRDAGQAVIVENGKLLGVEDEAGTDALISRCTVLNKPARSGVLVKVKKPAQESRADLPAIGLQTVENIHRAGLSGIAIEAGGAIVLDREQVGAKADALGVFVVGVRCG